MILYVAHRRAEDPRKYKGDYDYNLKMLRILTPGQVAAVSCEDVLVLTVAASSRAALTWWRAMNLVIWPSDAMWLLVGGQFDCCSWYAMLQCYCNGWEMTRSCDRVQWMRAQPRQLQQFAKCQAPSCTAAVRCRTIGTLQTYKLIDSTPRRRLWRVYLWLHHNFKLFNDLFNFDV